VKFYFRDLSREEAEGMLQAFAERCIQGPLRRIVVSRMNVWKSSSSFWKLPLVNGRTGLILVKFSGENNLVEPSADEGGPRREFFELLFHAIIKNSGVFSTGIKSHYHKIPIPK
jgi:hypothetical protein